MATDQLDTATAPTTAPDTDMRMVDLQLIEESLTNPRRTFNQQKLAELAETIKQRGVVQPVLLRPLPGTRMADTFGFRPQGAPLPVYELVSGARRLRASHIAGAKTIPAMIRALTDREAREIQHIENIQREDVDKLEEAESFRSLLDDFGMTADAIGEKIGQSRSYVYAALKILDLCQVGRQALRDGKLDFSKALQVARIPSESQQLKAIKDLTETDYDGELRIGARRAAAYIREHYMLALDKAPFSRTDADLLPGAGACTNCPKRTGANPELFADVKSADVCTDAPCYHKKEEAHAHQLAEQARAKGQTVIESKESAELVVMGGYGPAPKLKGYRRLDFADDSPTDQPLRKIIGKQMQAEGIEAVLIENPRKKGDMLACLPNEVVLRLLKIVEAQATAPQAKASTVSKEARELAEQKKAAAEARAHAQYEQAWRDALLARTWNEVGSSGFEFFTLDVHRYLVKQEAARLSTEQAERIAARLDLGKVGAHSAVIDYADTTATPHLLHLLIIMERTSRTEDRGYLDRPANAGLMLVAGVALQDKLPVVINQVQAEAKAKYMPEREKPAAATDLAAQAGEGAEGAKGGKGAAKKSAARAGAKAAAEAPKTSKAKASADIAAAMQALEGESTTGSAAALQGDEAPAPAGAAPVDKAQPKLKAGATAKAQDVAPTAQGNEAQPVATAQATPQPAGEPAAPLPRIEQGALVRVKADARGADGKRRKTCGRVGVVETGGKDLVLRFGPKSHEVLANITSAEVEPYNADPLIGSKVRVLHAGMTMQRNEYRWRQGTVKACKDDGWEIMFPGVKGGVATFMIFGTEELEVLE
ncbi:ParB/RepB/Spo0J family partition protein [Acidovorax sp. Q11]